MSKSILALSIGILIYLTYFWKKIKNKLSYKFKSFNNYSFGRLKHKSVNICTIN